MERDHLFITDNSALKSDRSISGRKPKILVIDNSVALTGALETALRSSRWLSKNFEFLFLLPSGNNVSNYVTATGFQSSALPMKEIRKDLISIILYVPALLVNVVRLYRFLKTQKIDLIHSNDLYNMLPPLYKIFGGSVPYICHVRFMPNRFPRMLTKVWFGLHRRFADAIVVVSQAVESQLPGDPKVRLIADCLPVNDALYISESDKILLYPANFTRGKGHEYAILAFAAIAEKFEGWKLRFIGGDFELKKNRIYKNELITLARKNKIENQVEWLDFSSDMKGQYSASAVVLNFSDSESFSLTCLEASFYGRPVVATDSGGPAEIILSGESGILVPRGELTPMIDAMASLMQDAQLRQRMGKRGREVVRDKFGPSKTTTLLGNLYQASVSI